MNYIKKNNTGIIALLKQNENYEYNAIDSSYCVLRDYEKEIASKQYFEWIKETKLEYEFMVDDFNQVSKSNDRNEIEDSLIWERPNIYIDFDSKLLVNYYPDRLFEEIIPKSWRGESVSEFWKLKEFIPTRLRYWNQCEILFDYITQFLEKEHVDEEIELLDKATKIKSLISYEERWNYIENEFGGNIINNKDYGWLSLKNYTPNLVINRETSKLYLAYLLDSEFQPEYEVGIRQIKTLLINEKI